MKWQPIHKRKKLGLALLEKEWMQEIAVAGLKQLTAMPELKSETEIKLSEETKTNVPDFVFMHQGSEIARVKDLKELLDIIQNVPRKSIINHINNNDFSKWFYSLGYKELAENAGKIKGGHKSVVKQLLKTCNSALQEQRIDYIQ